MTVSDTLPPSFKYLAGKWMYSLLEPCVVFVETPQGTYAVRVRVDLWTTLDKKGKPGHGIPGYWLQ